MPSAFLWPVLVPSALCAPAPVNLAIECLLLVTASGGSWPEARDRFDSPKLSITCSSTPVSDCFRGLGRNGTLGQELTLNNVYFGAVNFVPFGHRGLKRRLFENPSLFTLTTFTTETF